MIKQYFKQAWNMLRANPLISTISIAGTALSIAMIMVVVLVNQILVAGYAPETHRDRMLYVNGIRAISDNSRIGSYISSQVVKECFYPLETAEAVTALIGVSRPVSLPSRKSYKEYEIKYTDTGFWTVFDFTFLSGRPFTEAEFQSAIPQAVITESLAKELFNKADVVGETVVLDFLHYTVCGVVKNVSEAANDAYGHLWVPYTTNQEFMSLGWGEGIPGQFQVCILAPRRADFASVRHEVQRRIDNYNLSKTEFSLLLPQSPIDRIEVAMGSNTFYRVRWQDFMLRMGGLLLFLILIPAINLTGVNQSSVQQRVEEMGVRKSFGATGKELILQIVSENMVITLIGGVIGFGLSFIFLLGGKDFFFRGNPELTLDMLLRPGTFFLVCLFILFLNVLSAFLPAVRISRRTIIDSLKVTK